VRSRNGNRPFLFSSLALITTLIHGADNYYIGYRLTTKNAQPIEESFTLSKAMKPCNELGNFSLTLPRRSDETLESLLNRERSTFIEYAAEHELRLKSNETLSSSTVQSLQTLTLPTRCYAVEFNDHSVTISLSK
jgi:aryl-phospho-beta-D-glucosidase BglC (GH1 family)